MLLHVYSIIAALSQYIITHRNSFFTPIRGVLPDITNYNCSLLMTPIENVDNISKANRHTFNIDNNDVKGKINMIICY